MAPPALPHMRPGATLTRIHAIPAGLGTCETISRDVDLEGAVCECATARASFQVSPRSAGSALSVRTRDIETHATIGEQRARLPVPLRWLTSLALKHGQHKRLTRGMHYAGPSH